MLGRNTDPKSDAGEDMRGYDAYDVKLGDMLRGERATLGKSLLDVQRELKINATYIAAIEATDPSVFETPGFIAGYVRSYSRYLGLDEDKVYERFCAESGFEGATSKNFGGPVKSKEAPRFGQGNEQSIIKPLMPYTPVGESIFAGIEPRAIGSVFILFSLIGLLGYGGLSVLREIQRVEFAPVDQTPGIIAELDGFAPTELDEGATEVAEGAVTTPSRDVLESLYRRPQALDAPVLTPRDGPIAALDPNTRGTLIQPPVPPAAEDEALVTVALSQQPPLPPVQVIEQAAPEVVMFAVRPAWVRVTAADGTILFEKTLNKGESYVLPPQGAPANLRAGNSGSIYFSVLGNTYGPAGEGAAIAKNVAMGVEEITSGYARADLESDPDLPEVLTAMAEAPLLAEPDALLSE